MISDLISSIDDNSSYEEIYDVQNKIENLKISLIKDKMNNIIRKNIILKYDKLPKYLNYILSILSDSYPIINKNIDKIINNLLLVDQYIIHPLIFNSILTNLIYNCYIIEIDESYDELKESLMKIQKEIEFITEIFSPIYNEIDNEFNNIDEITNYNYIEMLNNNDFNKLFDSITLEQTTLKNKFIKLNCFFKSINNMLSDDINENINIFVYDKSLNKFNNDINILNKINTFFNNYLNNNYNYLKKYLIFSDINFKPKNNRNVIYYWTDIIAYINCKEINNYIT